MNVTSDPYFIILYPLHLVHIGSLIWSYFSTSLLCILCIRGVEYDLLFLYELDLPVVHPWTLLNQGLRSHWPFLATKFHGWSPGLRLLFFPAHPPCGLCRRVGVITHLTPRVGLFFHSFCSTLICASRSGADAQLAQPALACGFVLFWSWSFVINSFCCEGSWLCKSDSSAHPHALNREKVCFSSRLESLDLEEELSLLSGVHQWVESIYIYIYNYINCITVLLPSIELNMCV